MTEWRIKMGKYKGFHGGAGLNTNKNMNNVLKQAQKMQEEMEKIQSELENKTVEASAGGGVINVTANGKKEILSIKIKPEAVDPEDVETLEDLIPYEIFAQSCGNYLVGIFGQEFAVRTSQPFIKQLDKCKRLKALPTNYRQVMAEMTVDYIERNKKKLKIRLTNNKTPNKIDKYLIGKILTYNTIPNNAIEDSIKIIPINL